MKLKSLVAASAIACATGTALADTTFNLGPIDGQSKSIGDSFAAGAAPFTDTYNFSLIGPNTLSGIVTTFNFMTLFGISGLSLSLTGGTLLGAATDVNPADGYSFSGLGLGNYALKITGDVTGTGGGAYGGVMQAAPVPEPETYALLLAGLGVIGFVARRRRPQQ